MQYVYFGLIPFLLAGWFVYRAWYKKRELYDGTTGANFLYLFIFTVIYIWLFGLMAGLLTGLGVLVVWLVWGNAVRSMYPKNNPAASSAIKRDESYAEYERLMDKTLGITRHHGKGKKR